VQRLVINVEGRSSSYVIINIILHIATPVTFFTTLFAACFDLYSVIIKDINHVPTCRITAGFTFLSHVR
jgi:hypothetical protein